MKMDEIVIYTSASLRVRILRNEVDDVEIAQEYYDVDIKRWSEEARWSIPEQRFTDIIEAIQYMNKK